MARVKPSDEKTTLILTNAPQGAPQEAMRDELRVLLVGIATDFKIEPKSPGCIALTFDSFDTANLAKKALMNAHLMGKQLTAAWQESKGANDRPGGSSGAGEGSSSTGGRASRSSGSEDIPAGVTSLHVSNISVMAGEEDLRELFARYGEVSRPSIVKNALGEKRGFGFVTLQDRDACVAAMRDLDQTEFFGQRIGVALAKATSGSSSSAPRNDRNSGRPNGRGGPDRGGRYDRGGFSGPGGAAPNRNERSGPYSGGPGGSAPAYPGGAYGGAPGYPYMPYGGAMPGWGYPSAYDPSAMAYAQQGAYGYPYDPHMYAAAAAAAAAGGYNPSAPTGAPPTQPPNQPPPRYY